MTGEVSRICGLVNLTVRCNQDCVFCCDGELKESGHHLSGQEARERILEVVRQGAGSVTLIGGEPLLRKDLPGLVAFARGQGLDVGVTTNGTLLTRGLLERLLEAGLTSIELSVHTFDPELADRVSRRRHTARRQRRALDLLRSSREEGGGGAGVSVNFVVFSWNWRELPSFAATLVREYAFVDEWFVNFLDPVGYPARDPSLVPRYSEVAGALREGLDAAAAGGLRYTVDSVPGCVLGRHFLFLRATRERLAGVLYAKRTQNIRDPGPDPDLSQYYRVNACFECPIGRLCPGVNFRYLGIYGPGEFRPVPRQMLAEPGLRVPEGLPEGAAEVIARVVAEAGREPLRREEVVLSGRCNNGCGECLCRRQSSGALSPGELVRRLERAAVRPGSREVLLSGGEAALHPGFFRILRVLSRAGVRAGFATNGRVFANGEWVKRVVASGAGFAVVRLPAPLEILDRVAGVAGAGKQAEEGIRNLARARAFGLEAEVECGRGTEEMIRGTVRFLEGLGVWRVRVSAGLPGGDGPADGSQEPERCAP